MRLQTIQYRKGTGWSVKEFPKLDSAKTVLFLFGSPELMASPEVFAELNRAFPLAAKVGCSSSGEIFGSGIFDQSLSVAIAQFQRADVKVFSYPINDAKESRGVGQKLGRDLAGKDLSAVFLLSDGLRVNGSELVHGISESVPGQTPVTGGLAGDGSRFKETWVIKDGKPVMGYVTALGLYGKSVRVGHGSKGGWDIFGPERVITKAEGNVLYELDGKPALQIYKDYLGEKASELPASALLFPLQIRASATDTKQLVRTILAVDEAKQAMVFAGDVPQGHLAQLMRANMDRLIDGAANAAKVIPLHEKAGVDMLTIAISCVGRRLVLGERTEEEVEATLDTLPKGAKQIGFYSYGEISPFVKGQNCELHNQTMTLTTISEEEDKAA
jgi:hypothetical protein